MSFSTQLSDFADSLMRIINSAKIKTAAVATVSAYFAVRNIAPSVPLEQRVYLWGGVLVAGITTFTFAIHGWTMEDVAAATPAAPAPPPAAPPIQVTTGDHAQVNAPSEAAPAPVAEFVAAPVPPLIPPAASQSKGTIVPASKIKLPKIIVLALLLLPLGAIGCQAGSADYVAYRDGLHTLDEPLYSAHEKLMTDAVKAGIRNADDQATVELGIKAARDLYTKSVAITPGTTATSTPAPTTPATPAPTP